MIEEGVVHRENIYQNQKPLKSMEMQKKLISDKLTLIRFFDVGIDKEGYWNYNQVALQVKDVCDVLSIEFNNNNVDSNVDNSSNVDFVIMMDQLLPEILALTNKNWKWERLKSYPSLKMTKDSSTCLLKKESDASMNNQQVRLEGPPSRKRN